MKKRLKAKRKGENLWSDFFLIIVVNNLGTLLFTMGKFEESESLLTRALDASVRRNGENHP